MQSNQLSSYTNSNFDDSEKFLLKLFEKSKTRSFSKGHVIFEKGEKRAGLFLLKKGVVGLMSLGLSGEDTLLRVFGKNALFGYRTFIAGEKYHATALALTQVQVAFLEYANCIKKVAENPVLFFYLSNLLAEDLRRAEERLICFSEKNAIAQVAEALVYLKCVGPEHLWTRREIGEFCGLRTETVSRVLTLLERKKLIKKRGKEILLNNISSLLNYSKDNRTVA